MTGRTILAALAGAMLAGGLAGGSPAQDAAPPPPAPTPAPQDPPPIVVVGPDADIVVTGAVPMLRGGLWQFRRSPTLSLGGGGSIRGFGFTACLADGALEEALRMFAGERSAMPRGGICTKLRTKIGAGRIGARRSCTVPGSEIGVMPMNSKLDVDGRYDTKTLSIDLLSEDGNLGLYDSGRQTGRRWKVTATRIADCPPTRGINQRTLEEAGQQLFAPAVAPDDY